MGTFSITVGVGDTAGRRFEDVDALVDTGSTYLYLAASLLDRLGVERRKTWRFELPDGQIVERDLGIVQVRLNGEVLPVLAVFGEEGAAPLLGAFTLEAFRLAVDPVGRRLVPVPALLK